MTTSVIDKREMSERHTHTRVKSVCSDIRVSMFARLGLAYKYPWLLYSLSGLKDLSYIACVRVPALYVLFPGSNDAGGDGIGSNRVHGAVTDDNTRTIRLET